MIKRIKILNFQSIKEADLKLGSFTAIVGPSDGGKSAIIRAIRALASNRTGQEFIRRGESACGVSIEFDDGSVSWIKGASAQYVVNHKDQFDKPGRSVPHEVASATHFLEIVLGTERVWPNFHLQFDMPFLLAESSALRAKIIGELSGINVLYAANSEAKRQEVAAKRELSIRQADLVRARDSLKAFVGLQERGARLERLASQMNDLAGVSRRCGELRLVISRLGQARDRIGMLANRVDRFDGLKVFDFSSLDLTYSRYKELANYLARARESRKAILALRERLQVLDNRHVSIQARLSEIKICPLCEQPIAHELCEV